VMIRNNDATELCITKGQEGFVVGWQCYPGPHGKRVLDTLFVQLHNPPKPVQIPGLPANVVPIVKTTKTIPCVFPSDLKETIERQQVAVLPNFAMTAHAAQGKTRPFNVVHLNSCISHMAYYSALSRSATTAGTLIIQGFDPNVITKGCSGYLRQEFRELEILDDVTRLKYEQKLPENIDGQLRNTVIEQYQEWKGKYHVPSKTDAALQWSAKDPLHMDCTFGLPSKFVENFVKPKNIDKIKSFDKIQSKPSSSKRKHEKTEPDVSLPSKRPRIVKVKKSLSPIGLTWDSRNWSCAYDSVLVILYNLWKDNPEQWSIVFENINDHLNLLSHGFAEITNNHITFEQVRDHWRMTMHQMDNVHYPRGSVGISVGILLSDLFATDAVMTFSQQICTLCNFEGELLDHRLGYFVHADSDVNDSTSQWIGSLSLKDSRRCPCCNERKSRNHIIYKEFPHLLVLEYPGLDISTSHTIEFVDDDDNISATLRLRGIIYHGHHHFTSRIISNEKHVWFHDGMTTRNLCIYDGLLDDMDNDDLKEYDDTKLIIAIYAQDM
jgi:hypothetical protein